MKSYCLLMFLLTNLTFPVYSGIIDHNSVYIQLVVGEGDIDYKILNRSVTQEMSRVTATPARNNIMLSSNGHSFTLDDSGKILLRNGNSLDTLLHDFPRLRVGREFSIMYYFFTVRSLVGQHTVFWWHPHILSEPKLLAKNARQTEDGHEIIATYRWDRIDKPGQYIQGDVIFRMLPEGIVNCSYDLVPFNATDKFLEAGLGFDLPEKFSIFRWLGEGPFATVPGKERYSEREIWALNKDDINFTGNRARVDLAAFYNKDHSGIWFVGRKTDFGVEVIDGRIFFNHNSLVSGFGTKGQISIYIFDADQVESIKGEFDIMILNENATLFNNVFLPLEEVESERPFLKSYLL